MDIDRHICRYIDIDTDRDRDIDTCIYIAYI